MRGIDLLDPAAVAARGTVCGSDHDVEILTLSDPTESLESRFAIRDGWKLILFTNGTKELFISTTAPPRSIRTRRATSPPATRNSSANCRWRSSTGMPSPTTTTRGSAIPRWHRSRGPRLGSRSRRRQLPNGIEAWFGTDPGTFSQGITEVATNGNVTTFSHPQNPNPPGDLVGTYEWSPNLIDWYAGDGVAGPPGGPTLVIVPNTSGAATTVSATASEATESIFLRAVVVENQ